MEWQKLLDHTIMQILLIMLVTALLQIVIRNVISRIVRRSVRPQRYETKQDERKREDTLINVFRTTAATALWLMALFSILSRLNINLASLATGAGLISVVIGLGAQNTIRDILAGIFILLEHQYRVGDTVTLKGGMTGIHGATGTVEEISLRITKLRDIDGTLNIVRNGEAAVITNHSFKFSNAVIDLKVHLETDIDELAAIMNKVGAKMASEEAFEKDILEPIVFLRVDSFTDAYADVRALGKVRPGTQLLIAGEYRKRLIKALRVSKLDIFEPSK